MTSGPTRTTYTPDDIDRMRPSSARIAASQLHKRVCLVLSALPSPSPTTMVRAALVQGGIASSGPAWGAGAGGGGGRGPSPHHHVLPRCPASVGVHAGLGRGRGQVGQGAQRGQGQGQGQGGQRQGHGSWNAPAGQTRNSVPSARPASLKIGGASTPAVRALNAALNKLNQNNFAAVQAVVVRMMTARASKPSKEDDKYVDEEEDIALTPADMARAVLRKSAVDGGGFAAVYARMLRDTSTSPAVLARHPECAAEVHACLLEALDGLWSRVLAVSRALAASEARGVHGDGGDYDAFCAAAKARRHVVGLLETVAHAADVGCAALSPQDVASAVCKALAGATEMVRACVAQPSAEPSAEPEPEPEPAPTPPPPSPPPAVGEAGAAVSICIDLVTHATVTQGKKRPSGGDREKSSRPPRNEMSAELQALLRVVARVPALAETRLRFAAQDWGVEFPTTAASAKLELVRGTPAAAVPVPGAPVAARQRDNRRHPLGLLQPQGPAAHGPTPTPTPTQTRPPRAAAAVGSARLTQQQQMHQMHVLHQQHVAACEAAAAEAAAADEAAGSPSRPRPRPQPQPQRQWQRAAATTSAPRRRR
jgi:hypothetical protein